MRLKGHRHHLPHEVQHGDYHFQNASVAVVRSLLHEQRLRKGQQKASSRDVRKIEDPQENPNPPLQPNGLHFATSDQKSLDCNGPDHVESILQLVPIATFQRGTQAVAQVARVGAPSLGSERRRHDQGECHQKGSHRHDWHRNRQHSRWALQTLDGHREAESQGLKDQAIETESKPAQGPEDACGERTAGRHRRSMGTNQHRNMTSSTGRSASNE